MLPNLQLLTQIQRQILRLPNQRKESKRKEHYCCYLLCEKAGLRVSEAINFDLSAETQQGLYKITKTKGQKERLVYIPKSVINELKRNNWQPNHTNRFNFYHFLRKIKRGLNLPADTKLTPHTLRRAFATYHAENGLPLPLLSKLLGHASVRTTALYWMNIYNDDGNDTDDILAGKLWLEKPKLESAAPINLNLGELPELPAPNLLASEPPPNYLTKIQHFEEKLSQIQSKKDQKVNEITCEKEVLQNDLAELSEQNTNLQQNLSEKEQIIKQLEQKLTDEQEKRTIAENNFSQERKISAEQKQINNHLCRQLQAERQINLNLMQKNQVSEQNYSNLQNAYQQAIKGKQAIIKLVQTEKQKADYYENQLKSISQMLNQWQKINYYQQLEQQNKTEAKIIQLERPPPRK